MPVYKKLFLIAIFSLPSLFISPGEVLSFACTFQQGDTKEYCVTQDWDTEDMEIPCNQMCGNYQNCTYNPSQFNCRGNGWVNQGNARTLHARFGQSVYFTREKDPSQIIKDKLAAGDECEKALLKFDPQCSEAATASAPKCIDFLIECRKKAAENQQAIDAALGGSGGQSGGVGKFPVRITPEEYAKLNTPIPYCALTYEGCDDVDDVVTLLVNIGKMIFAIIGTFAFLMFIYGGFTMILAMGNPEKFKKGSQILVAAVVGLVISLSAYLLINFILDALGVGTDFRAL